MIKNAVRIANNAHAGQLDKQGRPYIFHVMGVAAAVNKKWGYTEFALVAAILHDVVEDTVWTFNDLIEADVENIPVIYVKYLTRDKDNEMYFEYINRVCENPIATRIKICDLEYNADSLVELKDTKEAASLWRRYEPALEQLYRRIS